MALKKLKYKPPSIIRVRQREAGIAGRAEGRFEAKFEAQTKARKKSFFASPQRVGERLGKVLRFGKQSRVGIKQKGKKIRITKPQTFPKRVKSVIKKIGMPRENEQARRFLP